MKTLVLAEQLRRRVPGGIGTYIRGLTKGLSELGEEPVLWASRRNETSDPLQALVTDVRTSALPGLLLTRLWDRGMCGAPGGFGVVHATSLAVPPVRDAALTVMVHDLAWRAFPEAFPPRGRRWHEAALRRSVERSVKIMTPSQSVAKDLMAGGVVGSQIEVIPHGCDHLPKPDHDGTARKLEAAGLEANAVFLLAVGTMEPRKNLNRLVAAYERIRAELPRPWPLVIAGPVGWGKALKPTTGVSIINDATHGEIAALYERCRLLAYVPLLEGYGLPVVEAMSMGAPVVASAVPSAADAAFQVDPTNIAAIAEGLARVATEDRLRSGLIDRGNEHAASTTWRASAKAHLAIWDKLK